MKKSLFTLLCCVSVLLAEKIDVVQAYEAKDYVKACFDGSGILKDYRGDEPFINTVAQACLEADMIDLLPNPIVMLKESEMGRQNAAFYATILFQKKLLYHALVDNVDISSVRAPTVDYILSKLFDRFVKGEYEKKGATYRMQCDGFTYDMRVIESARHKKIEIKKLEGAKTLATYYYW